MFSKFIAWLLSIFSDMGKDKVVLPPAGSGDHDTPPPSTIPLPAPSTPVETKPTPAKVVPHGVWIWDLSTLASDYLDTLCKIGCRRVYLKVFDDANYTAFQDQASAATIKRFTDRGIEVWGWGYHFDGKTTIDVKKSIDVLVECVLNGITGYVFDVEAEVKNPATHAQLRELIETFIKRCPKNCTIGYTSFGYPGLHKEVPYAMLQELCNCQFPQMYYELYNFASNDKEIQECWDSHVAMGLNKKPIYPIWCSEPGTKNPASQAELQKYLDAYPGSSMWRAPGAKESCLTLKVKYGDPLPIPKASDPIISGNINAKLLKYYSTTAGYKEVYNDVMSWYGTTSNGCVAFMSSALRKIGVAIPKSADSSGESISLVTLPFSNYLINVLKWKKITVAADLRPGDVILTIDAPQYPGYPAHTYMFVGWVDQARGIGSVVDNQDFVHNRNIFGYGTYNFSPFKYGLRAP